MQNIAKHGSPTTTGGYVIATRASLYNGSDRLAIDGDQATCGNCPGLWPVYASGQDMTDNGRSTVLDDDPVFCPCEKNRVIADAKNMSYQSGRAARVAASAVTARTASPIVARGTAPTPTPSPAPSAAPASPSRDKAPDTASCVLHIGMFFDGTGNNASNTTLFAQCHASTGSALGQSQETQQAIAEHCKSYMLKAGSSYEGGYTNVWRLYQLYRDSKDASFQKGDTDYFMRIYIDGIGTTAGKPDTMLPGYTFGTGETGMIERVRHAITESVLRRLRDFGDSFREIAIEAIEFDVFGFSRGAAAARHFVNEINRKQQGPLAQALPSVKAKFVNGFDVSKDTRVGFVGLFDTVVSRATFADGFNVRAGDTGPLHVGLPAGCARQVVQLAARDEHRANFMLTTVTPQHREIKLPGVHSDVGGGYHERHEGPLMLIAPIRSQETFERLIDKDGKLNWRRSAAAERALYLYQQWVRKLGGLHDPELELDGWCVRQHLPANHDAVETVVPMAYATIKLERSVDPSFQLIALRVMHKLASEAGVQWERSPDDVPAMRFPTEELRPIAAKLLSDQPLTPDEEAMLARKYLHQSAHWNFGADTKYLQTGIALELLYPHHPEHDKDGNPLPRRVLPNL